MGTEAAAAAATTAADADAFGVFFLMPMKLWKLVQACRREREVSEALLTSTVPKREMYLAGFTIGTEDHPWW